MNFLGHLFLSGTEPLAIVGNFMADGVKGGDLSAYHPLVEEGIRTHRRIDSFTDTHPLQRAGRERLRDHAGRYSGVVMDLFYDHLLAADWQAWHREPLAEFAQRMYALLKAHEHLMPDRARHMLPYMIQGDWLTGYARPEGLARALHGLSRRAVAGAPMAGAERVLLEHHDQYRSEFGIFLPEIAVYVGKPL